LKTSADKNKRTKLIHNLKSQPKNTVTLKEESVNRIEYEPGFFITGPPLYFIVDPDLSVTAVRSFSGKCCP